MEGHILTSRPVKTARIHHLCLGSKSCAPWESNHPLSDIIDCKPALMVSSEVAQPNVVALLSKSEGWSSVVRSSKKPGQQMDLQFSSDSEVFQEYQPGCRAPNHPVLHEDNGSFSNNPVHVLC